jgi:membrane protein required for colicin V production
MNWLDILIAIIIALPTLLGFKQGFLRKILGIAGIIVGFILAVKFYKDIGSFISSLLKINELEGNIIAFLLIIAILFFIAIWLARFISHASATTSKIDKILGLITGFIQGVLIASILAYNLSYINFPSIQTRQGSRLFNVVYPVAPAVFDRVIELSPPLKFLYDEYKKAPFK